MRIGLVGYYGWGNYGDELFLEAFRRFLRPHEVEVVHQTTDYPFFEEPVEQRVDRFDAIVVGGGDLVIPWALSPLYWKREFLRKPVYVYGVGVPTWGGRSQEVVDHLASFFTHPRTRMVVARDPESRDWIAENLGPSAPLHWYPDPVCALSMRRPLFRRRSRRFTLVTRAHQNLDYEQVAGICHWAREHGYRVHQLVLSVGRTAKDDVAEAEQLVDSRRLVTRPTIRGLTAELAASDLIASMKFHGCVVGWMLGIPVVSLSRADKFVSFYKMLGKEELLTTVDDPGLRDCLDRAEKMRGRKLRPRELRDKAIDGLRLLRRKIETDGLGP